MSLDRAELKALFEARFDRKPEVLARAPGRVNLIGEHTDYNGGYVLPVALALETTILAAARRDSVLRVYTQTLDEAASFDLGELGRDSGAAWTLYLTGVVAELHKLGHAFPGADVLIAGDVPLAAGLSSSASLEMALVALFEALGDFSLEGAEAPRLGQRVENEYLGLASGIMDQFVSRFAREGHALFLDCETLGMRVVEVAFEGAVFVIAHTGVKRGLTASAYNARVQECRQAVAHVNRELDKAASSLREVSMEDLERCAGAMPEVAFRRARHVIGENARTLAAVTALEGGDAQTMGRLMNESDRSLTADYEVSCLELGVMTETARSLPGCHGARLTGAGFGGCTVNLVESDALPGFSEALLRQYGTETGLDGQVYPVLPSAGASAERL